MLGASHGSFAGSKLQGRARHAAMRNSNSSRRLAVSVRNESCLIVNTKGGGHAFIGLHLAKRLLADGHRVTILNDGDQSKLRSKAPFSRYQELERRGVQIVFGDPTDPRSYPRGEFDVVYDNNGKSLDVCAPLIDTFRGRVQHYVFVGSAGAYKPDSVEPMHVEDDPRKSSAGHVEVETYLRNMGLPFTVFQPLYIYGPDTAKDCEQWFIDRIIRNRPVPIPKPGVQLTSLTHVEDVADMLARVPRNERAIGQHYNVCSDRCITFVGIAKAIAKSLNREAEILLYDPKKVDLKKGEGFPFRAVHFFASSDKAKRDLGWQPRHNFLADVDDLVADYKASGRANKDVNFAVDDLIISSVRKPAYSW